MNDKLENELVRDWAFQHNIIVLSETKTRGSPSLPGYIAINNSKYNHGGVAVLLKSWLYDKASMINVEDEGVVAFELSCIPGIRSCIPGIRSCIPGIRSCIPGIRSCIPGIRSCIPGIRSCIPGIRSCIPGIRSCIPGIRSCIPGIRSCIPGIRSCIPGIRSCIPGIRSCIPGIRSCIPGIRFCGVYNEPTNSPYFRHSTFAAISAHVSTGKQCVILGDLNARFGHLTHELVETYTGLSYHVGDNTVNENGRSLTRICKENCLLPVNNLTSQTGYWPSQLTFRRRNNWISEVDCCLIPYSMVNAVTSFSINQDLNMPSDHAPVSVSSNFVNMKSNFDNVLIERSDMLGTVPANE